MSSSLCQICKIRQGQIYPELASALPDPICERCLKPSCGGNWRRQGRPSRLPTFSVEFEIKGDCPWDRNRALVLLPLGYLRTSDCTVDDEYKSPMYHSLPAFRAHLPVLDTLQDLVNEDCGTHLHVGLPFPLQEHLTYIRDEVFSPLVGYFLDNEEETAWFWGRTPCYYASESLNDSYACIRTESRYDTIEFRLARFRNAFQYLEVVRFCRRLTYALHQELTAIVHQLSEARTPSQLGDMVLMHYQETVENQQRRLRHIQMQAAMRRLAS